MCSWQTESWKVPLWFANCGNMDIHLWLAEENVCCTNTTNFHLPWAALFLHQLVQSLFLSWLSFIRLLQIFSIYFWDYKLIWLWDILGNNQPAWYSHTQHSLFDCTVKFWFWGWAWTHKSQTNKKTKQTKNNTTYITDKRTPQFYRPKHYAILL